MAFEYVVVKEEFESKEDANTGVLSAVEKNEPEHNNKNNKVEIAVLIPNNTRIKTELIDPPSSPDGSQTSNASWLVPIKEEVKEVLPEKYLEVTIKEEVPESEDDEPAFDGHTSDESAVQTSPTSSDELDHQRSGSFACDICGKSYTNTAYLQRHLQFHSKNAVQCNQCNRQFLNKLRLNTHIFNRHTLVTPYPCDQCPEKFKSKYYLREHKKTHSDEKAYQCSECLKSFTVKRKLQRHQSRTSCKKTSDDPIPCKICKTVFENESLLKSHMKEEHDSERSFPCDECSTIFKQKSTLMRHMHVHTGIRPYPCPHCGKTFTSSGLLKPHLRVHTGEKPYSCNICDKKFAHKHNMQRHMLGHEKIKHTVCDICHKEFPRESRLKYHMKTHVNEKYFMCKVCPKRFSHKQNVIRHYTRKHPGQTYQCTDTDASVAAKVWDTMKKRYCDEETEEILG